MNLLKLVKLQNLVTKCCTENIALRSLHILYMFVLRAEIVTIFQPKMVTISVRNKTYTKFGNFARLYFPSFTTFCNFVMFFLAVMFDSLLFT
jgi:hypothetical protein